MKPITWLRKFAERGFRGYPLATLGFYGPDDRKASKVVLGLIDSQGAEPQLHKWIRETEDKDLRYDVGLQKVWIEIIRRDRAQSLAMMEEINGCPHEEGVDYPVGESCPECPFWAGRRRPLDRVEPVVTAIATYNPAQWKTLIETAADSDRLEDTWEEWQANKEKLTMELRARGLSFVEIELDVDEINRFCAEEGIPNDGHARARLAARKAEEESGP